LVEWPLLSCFIYLCIPPGAACARLPVPIIIGISKWGWSSFFQVNGPCFRPLGKYAAVVVLNVSG
jgi:hypothetical protein